MQFAKQKWQLGLSSAKRMIERPHNHPDDETVRLEHGLRVVVVRPVDEVDRSPDVPDRVSLHRRQNLGGEGKARPDGMRQVHHLTAHQRPARGVDDAVEIGQ